MNNVGGKKGKRNAQPSILPEIPGVPIDVVPFFLEALKLATKFFQRSTEPYSRMNLKVDADSSSHKSMVGGAPANTSVHESIMDRIETATRVNADAKKEEKERLERMNDAVGKWLELVKRFVRSKSKPREDKEVSSTDEQEKRAVPYACFDYLWNMQQDHPRVPVRRAAVLMSGHLLQKSRDCRFHLEQGSNLSIWISNIVAEGVTWKSEQARMQLPLLQKEAWYLLQDLINEGYADMYPKIGVAQQRLAQQCPNMNLENFADVSEITTRRRFRDIALEHGATEIERVQKLIRRCQHCLEILVPRIGDDPEAETTVVGKTDSDEEDENDIDWDDGDEFDGDEVGSPSESDHAAAVERTLAAMQSSGGLRGGEIEIDLAKAETFGPSDSAPVNLEALTKLEKHVKVLGGRHMPRLTKWIDGLINADNLVTGSSSLVSLSSSEAQRRKDLVSKLSDLRQQASSILSSASRLDVKVQEERTIVSSPKSRVEPVQWPTFNLKSRKRHLVSSQAKQRTAKQARLRSARIEIKLRK